MPADEAVFLGGLFLSAGAPAKKRPDAGLQLENIERLGEIIVRAVLKAHELVHVLRARRQHDDRHVRKLADLAAGLQPVDLWHHDVQHDQLDLRIVRQRDGLPAVAARDDLVAVVLQIEFDSLDDDVLIVHDQNFHIVPPR